MIKISTLLNVPSQIADKKKIGVAAPGAQAVKMLEGKPSPLIIIGCYNGNIVGNIVLERNHGNA